MAKRYFTDESLSALVSKIKAYIGGVVDSINVVISGKADKEHDHEISKVNGLQTKLNSIDDSVSQKSQAQIIIWEAND